MVSTRVWVYVGLAIALEATIAWASLEGAKIYEPEPTASQVTEDEKMLPLGAAAAALFPIILAFVGIRARLDPFALGSIIIAVIVEVALFVGWARSLQAEAQTAFWVSTTFPALLIALTFYFHRLQKDRID